MKNYAASSTFYIKKNVEADSGQEKRIAPLGSGGQSGAVKQGNHFGCKLNKTFASPVLTMRKMFSLVMILLHSIY